MLPLGLFWAVSCVGLLKLKNWGRIVTSIGYGVWIVFAMCAFIRSPMLISRMAYLVELVIFVAILVYLSKKDIREAFAQQHE
jgi:uncharacterized membrane protein (DUF2068 family)